MTFNKVFFCTQCGTRLPKDKVCTSCGFNVHANDAYGDRLALGSGGLGWSDAINHPRLNNYQRQKRFYIMLFVLVLVIGIPLVLLAIGDLSFNSEGLIVSMVISLMFLSISLYAINSTKRIGEEWIGTVVEKNKSSRNNRMPHLIIQKEDKSLIELSFDQESIKFDYFRVGDIVKQHNQAHLRALEKFDKRQDEFLFCPSCAYMADARDTYCQACGSPLLKGGKT
jgi:rubrerythrin